MSNNPYQENPWEDPARDNLRQPQQPASNNSNNPFYQPSHSPNPWTLNQDSNYAPPPGPPPGHQQQQAQTPYDSYSQPGGFGQAPQGYSQQQPGGFAQQQQPDPFSPPKRTGTFEETDFIPASERGEQREAMEQFELSHHGVQSTDDKNVETLQREFPNLDGSLVAAIYGDSKDMGATREMLGELARS